MATITIKSAPHGGHIGRKLAGQGGHVTIATLKHMKQPGDCFEITPDFDIKAGQTVQVTLGETRDEGDCFVLEVHEGVEP